MSTVVYWKGAEIKIIKSLWGHEDIGTIVKKVGRTYSACISFAHRNKLGRLNPGVSSNELIELIEFGYSINQIADSFKVSKRTVQRYVKLLTKPQQNMLKVNGKRRRAQQREIQQSQRGLYDMAQR